MRRWLLVVALAACEQAVTEPRPPTPPVPTPAPPAEPKRADRAYFRWDFAQVEINRIGLTAGSWVDEHDRVVWSRAIPGRIGALSLCCWDSATEAYLASPRHSTYAGPDLEPTVLADAVVLQHDDELVAFAKSDGRTVFSWSDPAHGGPPTLDDPLIVDDGSLEITVGDTVCRSALGSSHFTRVCGDLLLYFDDGTLAAFAYAPWRLIEARRVKGTGQDCSKPTQVVDRTETIAGARVRFRGERITMCIVH